MMALIEAVVLAVACLGLIAAEMIDARQKPNAPAPLSVPVFDDEDPEPSWLT